MTCGSQCQNCTQEPSSFYLNGDSSVSTCIIDSAIYMVVGVNGNASQTETKSDFSWPMPSQTLKKKMEFTYFKRSFHNKSALAQCSGSNPSQNLFPSEQVTIHKAVQFFAICFRYAALIVGVE